MQRVLLSILLAVSGCAVSGCAVSGCAGEVEATIRVVPAEAAPAPTSAPPTPTDAPGEATSTASPEAPAPAPFAVDGDSLRYPGAFTFEAGGALAPESGALVAGIATLIAEHPEIELVEVSVHEATVGADSQARTRERAEAVAAALTAAGLDKKRVRAAGYAARCKVESTAAYHVAFKVVRRAGHATRVSLCDPR